MLTTNPRCVRRFSRIAVITMVFSGVFLVLAAVAMKPSTVNAANRVDAAKADPGNSTATIDASGSEDFPPEFTPRGTVLDVDQKPVRGARITLHFFRGTGMSAATQQTETDASGKFEFSKVVDNVSWYAVVQRAPYASALQKFSDPENPMSVILRPAVNASLQIKNVSGSPLSGARITNMNIRTPEYGLTYMPRGREHLMGWEFTYSDAGGNLNLPPLPNGALVDIRIDHPQWAQAKISNFRVDEGNSEVVSLPAGIPTTFELVADERTPMDLEGLVLETDLFSESSQSAATLNRIPMTVTDNCIRFSAHPAQYEIVTLSAPGVAVTPQLNQLVLEQGPPRRMRFLVRKTVEVTGRVIHRNGMPHRGAQVGGRIENLSPDGPASGAHEGIGFGNTETDIDGRFTMSLPPGRSFVSAHADGFLMDRVETEIDVRADGPNEIPDFLSDVVAPIQGQIIDATGHPVPGAIIRIPDLVSWTQPIVSDADGKFSISIPFVPSDPETQLPRHELKVVAYIANQPLMGVASADLRSTNSMNAVRVTLRPDETADSLLKAITRTGRSGNSAAGASETTPKKNDPTSNLPQSAPELDGLEWLNTDARSLSEFRGRYVLLDFWYTTCGPCHEDFPSVKLVHEKFAKLGVTVIGIHNNSSTPEAVREHCQKLGLTFPIVVDHADGRIVNAWRDLGIQGFPSYFLINPEGTILQSNLIRNYSNPPSNLRDFKLEVIRKYVLGLQNQTSAPPIGR